MANELVSIITPTWNCGRFIAQTIESVLAQTYANWEMIIVDDCSTDDTRQVIQAYKDSRIKYHCLDKNSGAAIARNTALRMARGRWIAFLDSDDLWKPTKLEQQLRFMVDNNYAFSYHKYTEIDEDSAPLRVLVGGIRKITKWKMFSCCWPGCLSVMYDADAIGLVQIEDVKKNNDTALWLKVVKKAPCYLLDEDLAYYRRRRGSITPVTLRKKISHHYPLFRVAEGLNPFISTFWVAMNIFGNTYKKIFYVKTIKA